MQSSQKNHDFPGSFINNRGAKARNTVMFVVAPALAVVGPNSKFFDIKLNRLSDELVFAPSGSPVL
jgi:hypothetical protein